MRRGIRRDIAATAIIALAASVLVAVPAGERLGGLSHDLLVALRHAAFGLRSPPEASPVAIVALDEETYRTPPFAGTPNVFWTRRIGAVIAAIHEAGAAAVGLDIVYPTSIEPFVPGFERDFLRALRAASRDGRLVLTKIQHSRDPLAPHPAQSFAVGHEANIRAANLPDDADGVIRRAPVFFERPTGGGHETAFAVELAARALAAAPESDPDGTVTLAGRRLAAAPDGTFAIPFPGSTDAIPAYSLADLSACAERGEASYFRRAFEGRTVIIGPVLDVEDRKLTAQRLSRTPERGATAARCALPAPGPPAGAPAAREAIPGVFVHATIADAILRDALLVELHPLAEWGLTVVFAALAAGAAMALSPVWGTVALAGAVLVWTGAGTAAYQALLLLPLLPPVVAGAVAFAGTLGYRFAVSDRDRRQLHSMFGLYLAPSVIDEMVETGRLPELGGEEREVTVFFSDVAGFTRLAEGRPPGELVELLNRYLSAMTDTIEAHGGFVDKYIGDAIVAIFGAPLDAGDHAARAVRAALACQERLAALNRDFAAGGHPAIGQRIGINSGTALVGNIGSSRRFNYTVMGDAVNLASRLEGANKSYGTATLASGATAAACPADMDLVELDTIAVVGRAEPVTVHTPGGALRRHEREAHARALAAYRTGRFAEAAAAWRALDGVSFAAAMAARAHALADDPPAGWRGVTVLDRK